MPAQSSASWAADMTPFIIFSLPRSRSFWLSRFLSFGETQISHDLSIRCASIEDFLAQFAQVDGTIETGAVLGWRVVRKFLPQTRIIVLRRPLIQVGRSLVNQGLQFDHSDLLFKAVELERLAQQPFVQVIEYEELGDEFAMAKLFESLLGRPASGTWFRQISEINLQIDLSERLWYLQTHQTRISQFKQDIITQSAMLDGGRSN